MFAALVVRGLGAFNAAAAAAADDDDDDDDLVSRLRCSVSHSFSRPLVR